MKKIICMLLTLVLLASSAVCLFSCGEPKDDGAEIKVYLGERVYDFDPTDYYVDSNADQIMSLLFDPLFRVDAKGKLKLDGAAKDYDVDEEERTILITLRETYWSNSKRVIAADYIYAWRTLLQPTNANPAAALLYDIENAYEIKSGDVSPYTLEATATSDEEIVIKYREGADYEQLLKNLACVATTAVREDAITGLNGGYWSKIVTSAVTNGPFAIGNIDKEANSFQLIRNVGYHQALDVKDYTKVVRPGQLVAFLEPINGTAALTYDDIENNTVFYMSDAPIADRAENKDKAVVADDLSTYTYVFNTENPLFAKKEVRQALSLVIDRNAIIEKIVFGKAATGFVSPAVLDTATGKSFAGGNLISATANKDKALSLLSAVDFGELKKEFTLTVNDDEESLAIAAIAVEAWKSIGFTVTVEKVGAVPTTIKNSAEEDIEFEDSIIQVTVNDAARGNNDFDVIAVDWQMYSTDAFVALSAFSTDFSGCGVDLPNDDKKYGSFGGYADAEYDKLIADAYAATDKAQRSALLHQAEEKLVDSACVIPLVFNESAAFVSEDISKLNFDGLGNFVFTDVKQKNYRDHLN